MIWIFFYSLIRISAGCELLDRTSIEVSKYSGEDVLLPCSCVHGQTHSRGLRWIKNPGASDTVIYEQARIHEDYRDRVRLFVEDSPGNRSLFISRLTKGDEGDYRCEDKSHYRDIRLQITDSPPVPPTTPTTPGPKPTDDKDTEDKPPPYFIIIPAALLAILLLGGGTAFLYFRCKGVKSAEMHNQNPKDDVTYTTVVHGGNPNVAQVRSIDDRTEYACIRTT